MIHTTHPRPAASRRTDYARAAVYLEFRGRDARAGDQSSFVDRDPAQLPCRPSEPNTSGELALDQLAKALRGVGDVAGTSAA